MPPPRNNVGVLLMAYGAVSGLDEIPAYLQDILGGRPVPEALVRDVTERYRRIGGRSPLLDISRAQAGALQRRLGAGFKVLLGMRHSAPTIAEAVSEAAKGGCRELVAVPLTPYNARMSVGAYLAKVSAAVREAGAALDVLAVESWHDSPRLIEAFAAKTRAALERFPEDLRAEAAVIFSAHSLPERILAEGDPYPNQLKSAAQSVARACGLKGWRFAYQSRGASGAESWLGPDVKETLAELAGQGVKAVVVSPIGFISDHLETLYDDDILYRNQAEELGLRFERASALNDDPLLIEGLADVVRSRLERR